MNKEEELKIHIDSLQEKVDLLEDQIIFMKKAIRIIGNEVKGVNLDTNDREHVSALHDALFD